jgi:hypothetical protein
MHRIFTVPFKHLNTVRLPCSLAVVTKSFYYEARYNYNRKFSHFQFLVDIHRQFSS